MALKIAIVGGGSAYAPGLINAFIQNRDVFSGAKIVLMDIAGEELNIVASLSRKLAENSQADITISATRNQSEAIEGANFVLSTFRQGGFQARYYDESIPLMYGVVGQETIGPGGFFFAMRTLPVIQSILNDIKKYAPEAVLINYTNPTQIVSEAVKHFSSIECISICDQTQADQKKILEAMEMQNACVLLSSIGFNHATWSVKFEIDGENGIDVMNRHLDTVLERQDVDNRVKRQFLLANEYNRLPNSYLQYYYYKEETLSEAIEKRKTRAEVIMESLPGYYKHFKEQSEVNQPKLSHVRGGSVFGDMAVEVIKGLVLQDGSIHTLNIQNKNALPDFSKDRIVEVPARLDEKGVEPLEQPHLPSEVLGLLYMLGEYQWLAANAIWNGDRKSLIHALASNPLVLSLSLAGKLYEHILPLIRSYIPNQFLSRWE